MFLSYSVGAMVVMRTLLNVSSIDTGDFITKSINSLGPGAPIGSAFGFAGSRLRIFAKLSSSYTAS